LSCEIDFRSNDPVGWKSQRSVNLEVEVHLSIVSQKSLDRNLNSSKESVFFLQDNLSFFLMTENLFVEEVAVDSAVAALEHFFSEFQTANCFEGEAQ
jgi:hypothetical protein